MPAGNDFNNNELHNARLMNAEADENRGIPALGKVVYRTDSASAELCIDTDPDPTENGGGTWTPLGGVTGPTLYLPDVSSDAGPCDLGASGDTEGYYWTAGLMNWMWAKIRFQGTGKDVGSGVWYVSLPTPCWGNFQGHITQAGVAGFLFHMETIADPTNLIYSVDFDTTDIAFAEAGTGLFEFSISAWYAGSTP